MTWFHFLYVYSEEIKDLSSAIQSLFVSLGVTIGGIWAYWQFHTYRQKYPSANISHQISKVIISDNEISLHVLVKITNVGRVIISLNKCDIRIQRVKPLLGNIEFNKKPDGTFLDREIDWPIEAHIERSCERGSCEIEPGETEEFCYDFILDPNIEIVQVYSHYVNHSVKGKKELGWSLTTIFDMKGGLLNAK